MKYIKIDPSDILYNEINKLKNGDYNSYLVFYNETSPYIYQYLLDLAVVNNLSVEEANEILYMLYDEIYKSINSLEDNSDFYYWASQKVMEVAREKNYVLIEPTYVEAEAPTAKKKIWTKVSIAIIVTVLIVASGVGIYCLINNKNNSSKDTGAAKIVESKTDEETIIESGTDEEITESSTVEIVNENTTEEITGISTEVSTEEETTEAEDISIQSVLLETKYYMPGIQSPCFYEYIFYPSGEVEELIYDYYVEDDNQTNSIVTVYNYYVDESEKTVTIVEANENFTTETIYVYDEQLKGFIHDYVGGGAPWEVPSSFDLALIPFEQFPNGQEVHDEYYENYLGYFDSEEETTEEETTEEETTEEVITEATTNNCISEQQAYDAVVNYCLCTKPSLSDISSDEYCYYWYVCKTTDTYYKIDYRSYTGAHLYYYVDIATGYTTITEFVPGITDGETSTGESFNAWDYL